MASTIKPFDAINFAKRYIKKMPIDDPVLVSRLLNDVSAQMWMAGPWRWTLGGFAANTALTSTTQDYTVTVPNDFLYLVDVYLADGASTRHLHIDPFLPATEIVQGLPSKAALIGASTLRLYPKPGTQPSSAPSIVLTYKKQAPVITSSNMNTAGTQVFDDEWFWVFEEGVLWRAYQFADDQRAGNTTLTSDGKFECTGQRGAFETALEEMKSREKMPTWEYNNPPAAETKVK